MLSSFPHKQNLSQIFVYIPQSHIPAPYPAKFYGKAILKAVTNGSSEFMSNISMNLVAMLYNIQLLKYADENGVAAYGVMMYVSTIFSAVFLGYSIGTAPVIGYHDSAKNYSELKGLLKKSLIMIGCFGIVMVFSQHSTMGLPPQLSLSCGHRSFSRLPLSFCRYFGGLTVFGFLP